MRVALAIAALGALLVVEALVQRRRANREALSRAMKMAAAAAGRLSIAFVGVGVAAVKAAAEWDRVAFKVRMIYGTPGPPPTMHGSDVS